MSPDLTELDRSINHIAATCQRIDAIQREAEMTLLDYRINRIAASVNQLQRLQERNELAARDPHDPRLKRRLPSVCKTMTSPTESASFLTRAVAAYRSGGDDGLRRFAEGERAAGRLE